MTVPTGGYVSNEVIAIQLGHLTAEISALRSELVRRDVYDEQRRADRMELESIKAQLLQAGQRRWGVWLAVIGAGLSLLVSLVPKFT